MLRYNFQEVLKYCKYDPINILHLFATESGVNKRDLYYLPSLNRKDSIYSKKNTIPSGDSFLIDPKSLLTNIEGHTIQDIYDYIRLASLRSIFDFNFDQQVDLPLMVAEDAGILVKDNKLLLIDMLTQNIKFKYEKINGSEKI